MPSRIALCGHAPIDWGDPTIGVRTALGAPSAKAMGVQTCGSVWECPECSQVVSSDRARDVQHVVNWTHGRGGSVWLLSLTVAHDAGCDLRTMRAGQAKAWSGVLRGAPWQRMKERYGLGYVRRLESTVGASGWHPHLHVILTADKPLDPGSDFWAWLEDRWCTMVARYLGERFVGKAPYRFDVERVNAGESASRYLTKLGLEMTDAFAAKRARNGNYTTWGLLDVVDTYIGRETPESDWCAERWREWCAAMKGAQQLTWSRGLRAAAGLLEEPDPDEVVAQRAALDGDPVLVVPRQWSRLILGAPHVRVPLFALVEQATAAGVAVPLEQAVAIVARSSFDAALAFELLNERNDEHLARIRDELARARAAIAAAMTPSERKRFDPDTWFARALEGHARGELAGKVRQAAKERRASGIRERIDDWASLGRVVDAEFADW